MKSASNWPNSLGAVRTESKLYIFSIFSSGGHFGHRNRTVLPILLEGHLSNIPINEIGQGV